VLAVHVEPAEVEPDHRQGLDGLGDDQPAGREVSLIMRVARSRAAVSAPMPRWAVWAAYAVPLCVLPSAVWRVSLVVGGDLPLGNGGWYPLLLSVVSMGLALLTLGLVHSWGEVVPRWIPLLGGRRIPGRVAFVPAMVGAIAISGLAAYAVLNLTFQLVEKGAVLIGPSSGDLRPPEGRLLTAAYAPLLAWGPLLAAVAIASYRRRSGAKAAA